MKRNALSIPTASPLAGRAALAAQRAFYAFTYYYYFYFYFYAHTTSRRGGT